MTVADQAVGERAAATQHLIGSAALIAETARAMAARFRQGGRLLVFGTGRAATDAEHVAVEFVHPVIVGKRALPALTLTADVATVTGVATGPVPADMFAHQLRLLAAPADIAMGISAGPGDQIVRRALEVAGSAGLLTVALVGGRSGRPAPRPVPPAFRIQAGTDDPLVVKEIQVTTYHVLWELVHVFLDHPDEQDP